MTAQKSATVAFSFQSFFFHKKTPPYTVADRHPKQLAFSLYNILTYKERKAVTNGFSEIFYYF